MNVQQLPDPSNMKSFPFTRGKRLLVLIQFFLIIFVYHILRDLKDTLIVTSCDTGAKIIPFLKIWGILPIAILANYLFYKLNKKYGRAISFYFLMGLLASIYAVFAFCLFPARESLHCDHFASFLETSLPLNFSGFTNMIRYWSFSLFYSFAELWTIIVITVLFWTLLNDVTPKDLAKRFYPLCILTANIAGIFSGETSYFICQILNKNRSWDACVQLMILLVIGIIIAIVLLHHFIFRNYQTRIIEKNREASFTESAKNIIHSPKLICIAILVIGFATASNLIEVVWKTCIKNVYPLPKDYNAYVNQITTIIGFSSLFISFLTRVIFKKVKLSVILIATPLVLFLTSFIFFLALQLPEGFFATFLKTNPAYFVMSLGSIYYVSSLSMKYSLFDTSKELSFLSIDQKERSAAKAMIDSVGTRLGKSGSSLLHQMLLLFFGATGIYPPLVGLIALVLILMIFFSAKKLGVILTNQEMPAKTQSRIKASLSNG